jgi:hypothetical protein
MTLEDLCACLAPGGDLNVRRTAGLPSDLARRRAGAPTRAYPLAATRMTSRFAGSLRASLPRSVTAFALAVVLGRSAGAQTPGGSAVVKPLTIVLSGASVCAGRDLTLTAKRDTAVTATWTIDARDAGGFLAGADSSGNPRIVATTSGPITTFRARPVDHGVVTRGVVNVEARADTQVARAQLRLLGNCEGQFGGEIARVTVGYEQIGASGIDNDQKFAFDFFISRPLPLPGWLGGDPPDNFYHGPRLRWWGDVRVASYPQPASSEVAAFVTGFATTVGKVKVGKLAQSAEFTTGLEVRLWSSSEPLRGFPEPTRQRFALMAFVGGGAVGPFPPEDATSAVLRVPNDTGSSQFKALKNAFPSAALEPAGFVAFRPQTPDRFLANFTGGLRLYTFHADRGGEPLAAAPAMVSVAWGRNDLIVPRELRRPPVKDSAAKRAEWYQRRAWHFAAYYPFALGDRTDPSTLLLYLFGDVWMAGSRAQFEAPAYQLEEAKESDKAVPVTDSRVVLITTLDKPRDTYRIGVAIDLVRVWTRLTQKPAAAGGTS